MTKGSRFYLAIAILLLASSFASAQPRRKIIINEDCSGPGGSNLQSKLGAQPVEVQVDLDAEKFYRMFVSLMSAPTPSAQ